MSAIGEIRQLIENQLEAIEREAASLKDALGRLAANGAAPTKPRRTQRTREALQAAAKTPAKPARRRRQTKPQQRSRVVTADKLRR